MGHRSNMQYIYLCWSALCSCGSWLVCISGVSSFPTANIWQSTQMFPTALVPSFPWQIFWGKLCSRHRPHAVCERGPVYPFWSRDHVVKPFSGVAVHVLISFFWNSNFNLSKLFYSISLYFGCSFVFLFYDHLSPLHTYLKNTDCLLKSRDAFHIYSWNHILCKCPEQVGKMPPTSQ